MVACSTPPHPAIPAACRLPAFRLEVRIKEKILAGAQGQIGIRVK